MRKVTCIHSHMYANHRLRQCETLHLWRRSESSYGGMLQQRAVSHPFPLSAHPSVQNSVDYECPQLYPRGLFFNPKSLEQLCTEQVRVSKRFSKFRDWTRVSHIAGRFFTIWATREAHSRPHVTDTATVQVNHILITPLFLTSSWKEESFFSGHQDFANCSRLSIYETCGFNCSPFAATKKGWAYSKQVKIGRKELAWDKLSRGIGKRWK